jgi:hypothetical protein
MYKLEPDNGVGCMPIFSGLLCAILGAFFGCMSQFSQRMKGDDGPDHLLMGVALGVLAGFLIGALVHKAEKG